MATWIEALPAYGRDYTAATHVQKDWDDGKDFQDALSGQYLNKETAEQMGLKVTIHFDRERKVYVPKK